MSLPELRQRAVCDCLLTTVCWAKFSEIKARGDFRRRAVLDSAVCGGVNLPYS
jgi:hypothetical protein